MELTKKEEEMIKQALIDYVLYISSFDKPPRTEADIAILPDIVKILFSYPSNLPS